MPHGQTKEHTIKVTAGVSQGSVLGPVLWIAAHNRVLKVGTPANAQIVAYAYHLVLSCMDQNEDHVESLANEVFSGSSNGLHEHQLALALKKTEAVLLLYVTQKAARMISGLPMVTPRVGGPDEGKRPLLAIVEDLVILCTALYGE